MRLSIAFALTVFVWCNTALCGAKEHFINGREYYDQARYKEAIEEFEKAYGLDAKAPLLFNIAQAYEKLGNLKKTVEYLQRYLKDAPKGEDTASIKNKIVNLQARIKKTGITVECPEKGAVVQVDGKKVGDTPVAGVIPLEEGMHEVKVSKPGFDDFVMNVGVSTGYSVPVFAKLESNGTTPAPVPTGEVASTTPTDDAALAEAPPTETEAVETTEEEDDLGSADTEDDKIKALDVVPWVITGVGAAAAVVGLGVFGTLAIKNDDKTKAHIADGVGWPGVALAAGGAVWGIIRLIKKKKERPSASAAPYFHETGAGVAASVTF